AAGRRSGSTRCHIRSLAMPDMPHPPERILLTTDTVGGVWTYAMELARALNQRGVAVELATMGTALSPAQRKAAAALPRTRVHESTYRLEWMADPWDDVGRAGEWLLELEASTRPDVVHLN